MNKPEFKIGETVTFKPYEKAIKAKVISIQYGRAGNHKNFVGTDDNRLFYELSGVDEPLKSKTTGRAIVESKFYMFWGTLHEEADQNLSGEWQRPKEIHERPEVIRDLVEFGYLQCKRELVNGKTGAEICYYK
jgi:hypothetical protein